MEYIKNKQLFLLWVTIIVFLVFLFLPGNRLFLFNPSREIHIGEGFSGRTMDSLYDLNDLVIEMNNSQFVLLWESTHGTEEYYKIRKYISQRLIKDYGFDFIAVEGDWSSIYKLNTYVKHIGDSSKTIQETMESLDRWPVWMWKNSVILELAEWLREYNTNLPIEERVGFYGIDLYDANDSFEFIINTLTDSNLVENEPDDLKNCFQRFHNDFNNYPFFVYETWRSCEIEIQDLISSVDILDIRKKDDFLIQQNLWVLKNAEKHYRYQIYQGHDSWNARASHFASTVRNIEKYYWEGSRGIVWAHNTHVGDSSYILGAEDMLNIGKIMREDSEVFILGFVKNSGKVSAGSEWESEKYIMDIPPALEGSYGHLLANQRVSQALFIFDKNRDWVEVMWHRAIGVTYDPLFETWNYVPTLISKRYDAIIFLNETSELLELNF